MSTFMFLKFFIALEVGVLATSLLLPYIEKMIGTKVNYVDGTKAFMRSLQYFSIDVVLYLAMILCTALMRVPMSNSLIVCCSLLTMGISLILRLAWSISKKQKFIV